MSKTTMGEAEVLRLRQSIQTPMRRRVLEAIELVLEEELTEALGTGRYERGEARRGYRNGHQTRRITTAVGTQTLGVPRAPPCHRGSWLVATPTKGATSYRNRASIAS